MLIAAAAPAADANPVVRNDNTAGFAFVGPWTYTTTATGYYNSDAHYATEAGAVAYVDFSGPSVTLVGGTNPDHGRADVQVCNASHADCAAPETIDTYASTRLYQQAIYSGSGFGAGTHSLKITVRSDSSGSGHYTDIDAVRYDDGASPITGTHYVDNSNGSNCSDAGTGTSPAAPWCDFTPLQDATLAAGTRILLARGDTWTQSLSLTGSGTSSSWITLSAYGLGARPVIRGYDVAADRTVTLADPSYWHISDLELAHAGEGLLIEYSTLGHHEIDVHDIYTHDLGGIKDHAPAQSDYADIQSSTGITVSAANVPTTAQGQTVLDGLSIRHNETSGSAGIYILDDPAINGTPAAATSTFQHVVVAQNYIHGSPVPSTAFEAASGTVVSGNYIDCSAATAEPQGTTCNFFSDVDGTRIENNVMVGEPETGSHDETAIDLEYKISNTTIQGNYFGHNAGAAIELLQLPWRAGDYSTGTQITHNIFVGNGESRGLNIYGQVGVLGISAPEITAAHNINAGSSYPTLVVSNGPATLLAHTTQYDNPTVPASHIPPMPAVPSVSAWSKGD